MKERYLFFEALYECLVINTMRKMVHTVLYTLYSVNDFAYGPFSPFLLWQFA